jgi:hypothetical protein
MRFVAKVNLDFKLESALQAKEADEQVRSDDRKGNII